MIISTIDTNGETVRINVEHVHRAIEAAYPDVQLQIDPDYWTGSQRSISLAAWHQLLERHLADLQVRVRDLEQRAGASQKRITFSKSAAGDVTGAIIEGG